MASKFQLLLLFTILALVCSSISVLGADDGFVDIDPNAPGIQGLGKFAVDEHNKNTRSNVVFQRVVKAQFKPITDFVNHYKLVIQATDGGRLQQYEAVVAGSTNSAVINTLISFRILN